MGLVLFYVFKSAFLKKKQPEQIQWVTSLNEQLKPFQALFSVCHNRRLVPMYIVLKLTLLLNLSTIYIGTSRLYNILKLQIPCEKSTIP